MPIGPKHRLGEQHPEVPRQFADREELIGVFEQAASELPPSDNEVLLYYGVGGIGKTSLRIELGRLLEEKHPQSMWAVLDFRNTTYRDVETALFWLRQELKQKYAVQFPSFDLAYAIYWQKIHPQTSFRQDPTQLEALLEEGTLFANVVSIVGEVPLVSLVPKLSKVISKTDRLFRDWWTKRGHRELYRLQEMEPAEIVEWLPAFWASDLKDYLEHEDRPAVLFMDTYEALWEGEGKRAEGRLLTQDAWVRELVSQLPEVLWVVTGRERVRWEALDEDWRNYLHQYLVGGLAEEDARRFLASCGVTEEALQEVIVGGSKGVPLYLDLAVDTYLQIEDRHQRDPSPSDFRGTPQDVLDRFLHYLDRSETETLKVLSVARFWDRDLFESLIEEFHTGYPATALPELRRFSFVQEEQTLRGTWTIHPLMREALEEHLDAELRGRVHRYLFDHYNDSLEGLEITAIRDEHKMALTEAFHHGRHVLATDELFDWFTTAGEVFSDAALWQFLIPLYEVFARLIEGRLGPEHPSTATTLDNLASLYRQQGHYEEAEPLYLRVLEISQRILGPEHPSIIAALGNLAELYSQQRRYEEAEPLFKYALEMRQNALSPEHPDIATALNNLAMLYNDLERYEEAEPLYLRAMEIREKIFGPENVYTADVLNNLAELYRRQRRYEEAEPLHVKALKISQMVLGPEHPDTLNSLNNLAMLYNDLERYEEAESLLKKALEIKDEAFGAAHPGIISTLNNLAGLYYDQERYEEVEPLYLRAIEVSEKAFGPDHPGIIAVIGNLAELYRRQGRYEEAEPLLKRALEISEMAFGPEHPYTGRSLDNLAELYRQQERYEKAEPLLKRVLGIVEPLVGPNDPNTAAALNNLANIYDAQERNEEAEPLFKRVAEISENVAGLYFAQERYEEAESLYLRALKIRTKVLGAEHPDTVRIIDNLATFYTRQGLSSAEIAKRFSRW